MNFSRINRYKRIPKPFREHSGTQTWKTRERMRTTPKVILILKQASSTARLHKTLAQKIVVTVVCQIFEEGMTINNVILFYEGRDSLFNFKNGFCNQGDFCLPCVFGFYNIIALCISPMILGRKRQHNEIVIA